MYTNTSIITMPFDGRVVEVITDANNEHWVSVRSVCAAIGVDVETQRRKLQSDAKYRGGLIPAPSAGGEQITFCIHLDHLNGWLFSINSNRCADEVKPRLLAYQQECFKVLSNHFMPRGMQDLSGFMQTITGHITKVHEEINGVKAVCNGLRTEVDELKEILGCLICESEENELRKLIREVKAATKMDGRAIVGHVKKTLNVNSIYGGTSMFKQMCNVLRNLMGKGVQLVPNGEEKV